MTSTQTPERRLLTLYWDFNILDGGLYPNEVYRLFAEVLDNVIQIQSELGISMNALSLCLELDAKSHAEMLRPLNSSLLDSAGAPAFPNTLAKVIKEHFALPITGRFNTYQTEPTGPATNRIVHRRLMQILVRDQGITKAEIEVLPLNQKPS